MEYVPLAIGLVVLAAAVWLWRRTRGASWWLVRLGRLVLVVPVLSIALVTVTAGGTLVWYTHRPLPPPVRQELFQGVTYLRDVRAEPRPLVIHLVMIDLDAPGISFFVTPPQPIEGRDLPARTTSQFLDEFDVQVAINANYFEPWWSRTPWDYYPHVGDPVTVLGFASSAGEVYAWARWQPTLNLTRDNRASIGLSPPSDEVYHAVSGNYLLLSGGQLRGGAARAYQGDRHPRTAVALDEAGETLFLVVVDGRQPGYSEGVTLPELAAIIQEYGGYDAINLDGGGSSTLVMAGEGGRPAALNTPIDNYLPGRERPVANHLGVRALPLPGGAGP